MDIERLKLVKGQEVTSLSKRGYWSDRVKEEGQIFKKRGTNY